MNRGWIKSIAPVLVAMILGCAHTIPLPEDDLKVLESFKQAQPHDRYTLADPTISALRRRIGLRASILIELIGRPESWDSGLGPSENADLKYTISHKHDVWQYFTVTIRDGMVVWVGGVESVIQM